MPYYIIIPFRPVLAAGALLALPLVLVRGWCSLLVVTGTAASRRQCRPCHLCWWYRSPVSAVSPVVASGWPVGGRWWCRSARRSALPRYVINTDILVTDKNAGNGHLLGIGASPYTPTCPSAAFSRNFLFLFFLFWCTESNP